MIIFGAEVFKRAKIVRDLDELEKIFNEMARKQVEPHNEKIYEFIFEYVVDCVRILIFFENYMKAELLVRGYCVHQINKDVDGFGELARQQRSRPISILEIEIIQPFEKDDSTETWRHKALKESTIGIRELVQWDYVKNYMMSDEILRDLIFLNKTRNKIHFLNIIEFQLFKQLASKIRGLNEFVDKVMNERINRP